MVTELSLVLGMPQYGEPTCRFSRVWNFALVSNALFVGGVVGPFHGLVDLSVEQPRHACGVHSKVQVWNALDSVGVTGI